MQLNINTLNTSDSQGLATWSTERTSDQLKAFIHGKMSDIDLEDLDYNFDN